MSLDAEPESIAASPMSAAPCTAAGISDVENTSAPDIARPDLNASYARDAAH